MLGRYRLTHADRDQEVVLPADAQLQLYLQSKLAGAVPQALDEVFMQECCMLGTSTRNERIEAFWLRLQKHQLGRQGISSLIWGPKASSGGRARPPTNSSPFCLHALSLDLKSAILSPYQRPAESDANLNALTMSPARPDQLYKGRNSGKRLSFRHNLDLLPPSSLAVKDLLSHREESRMPLCTSPGKSIR